MEIEKKCQYTKSQCHHDKCKCSECPATDLICDEFSECIDAAYNQGWMDSITELRKLVNATEGVLKKLAKESLEEVKHGNAMSLSAAAYFWQKFDSMESLESLIENFVKGERAEDVITYIGRNNNTEDGKN